MSKSDSKRNSKQDPVEEEEEMETGGGKTKKKKSEEMGVASSHKTNKVEGEGSSSEAMDKKDEELEYEAESEESDDGVKEGEKPTYIGECDIENPLTSPWIRRRFKRERKQRLKEIEDLKQKAKKVKEKCNETKRLKRQKKRKELEDEMTNVDTGRIEERLGHMFQKKHEKIMRRMMSHNEYEPEGSHYRRGYRDRLYRGRLG